MYEDNHLCPDFLGLAEGLEQIEQEESPLKYVAATGEILEDPIASSTAISSESSKEIEENAWPPQDLFLLGCKAGGQCLGIHPEISSSIITPTLIHALPPPSQTLSNRTLIGSTADLNKPLSTSLSPLLELKEFIKCIDKGGVKKIPRPLSTNSI
ncbi:uncharacterized protein FIBRA_09260 [Fibroporia radiculosa]|uniref:Uncharacterized protein n=1 Tax=Fibroporia radiculosa TaxID=599839 RepID=J7SC77_9APHY|nr:uncharacterized protein FIBRA_09260 [Fibroporia radiculosa]CCM06946.1 predicted protein [Fibroporia radiculosa]